MTYRICDVAGGYDLREIEASSPKAAVENWIEQMVEGHHGLCELLPLEVLVEHDGTTETWRAGGKCSFSGSAWQMLDGVFEEE
jgi:hypothetical protein